MLDVGTRWPDVIKQVLCATVEGCNKGVILEHSNFFVLVLVLFLSRNVERERHSLSTLRDMEGARRGLPCS